ncbi:hypothetical protein OPV22_026252 [Ensete ventricosum]|uniref:Pentacotripeptide-repeat region of PRORP domain-containing protein n=1 Tax=Ensete ventricosum TaxID=4639 RepID=A0AAV8QFB7_ENSVE|nr:hypothetical protein OPV22_026252 [Ensete ventricosum]
MIEKGFTPTTFTYNIILKGLCKGQNTDEVLEFLNSFARGGNGPDLISFNTILSSACKQGDSSMIRRVLARMAVEYFNLDIVGMICLMQYFSKDGRLSESFKLVKKANYSSTKCLLTDLYHDGLLPDATAYGSLCYGLRRKGSISAAVCLEPWMLESGRTYLVNFFSVSIKLIYDLLHRCPFN